MLIATVDAMAVLERQQAYGTCHFNSGYRDLTIPSNNIMGVMITDENKRIYMMNNINKTIFEQLNMCVI